VQSVASDLVPLPLPFPKGLDLSASRGGAALVGYGFPKCSTRPPGSMPVAALIIPREPPPAVP
jgi:hypothetical protein